MCRAATFNPTVWRWQGRYLDEGGGGAQAQQDPPLTCAAVARGNTTESAYEDSAGDDAEADRRGRYSSVDDLEDEIYDYPLLQNTKPKPFARTKSEEDILARECRALEALDKIRGNW